VLRTAAIFLLDCCPKDITVQIAGEIYAAPERLGADAELLAVVGSWRDTLDNADVLAIAAGVRHNWKSTFQGVL
jgi:hypothetical protein